MKKFTYKAYAFRQGEESPIQLAFIAHAADVIEWAGVPRKDDELLTGYQRFKDVARIEGQIAPFFANPKNCSPTAVIVALRKETGVGSSLIDTSTIATDQIQEVTLTISIDDEAFKTNKIFETALEYVSQRLSDSEDDEDEVTSGADSEEDDFEADDLAEGDDDPAQDGSEALHLGTKTLANMKALLEDASNWTNPSFRDAIEDYVKPAFLIDGQHRIFGAAKFGERGLPFLICGLYDAKWEEQVFHFTVVNYTPKRIPPALITSIAGLSLTHSEQLLLTERLQGAGLRFEEVEIMGPVAYDDQSPFYKLINMAVGAPNQRQMLLGYASILRVARSWHKCKHTPLVILAKTLFGVRSVTKARSAWRKNKTWFTFFCIFWNAIRNNYPKDLWEKRNDNHLFNGAILYALQEAILPAVPDVPELWTLATDSAEAATKLEPHIAETLRKNVAALIQYFPEELWRCHWKKTEAHTSDTREELRSIFTEFITRGKQQGRAWRGWKSHYRDWFE